jgi:transcriptional regulator of nitric oxide reductase
MRSGHRWMALVVGALVTGSWIAHAGGQQQQPAELPKLSPNQLLPGCMQVVSTPGEPMAAVVYDPQQQVLGVYHIDRKTGEIELKSVRQIQWDLQMLHHQGKAPLPEDIKRGLEGARGQ